jgi:sugar (pentulose or hexulose) kinase
MSALNIKNTQHDNKDEALAREKWPVIVLGIDIGTSGIRGAIVAKTSLSQSATAPDLQSEKHLYSASVALEFPIFNVSQKSSTQNPSLWIAALDQLLILLSKNFNLACITHLVLDATSSTVLLCDETGLALSEALMYNDQQASQQAQEIAQHSGFDPLSAATGPSSTLAKSLLLIERLEQNLSTDNHSGEADKTVHICHQIDYLNHYLSGILNTTDANNALKLGYDSIHQAWPKWIEALLTQKTSQKAIKLTLPRVVLPGTKISVLRPEIIHRYGFSTEAFLHAGTTDSIAGFLASGATEIGDVVISLGSTIAIKVISDTPIFDHKFGIYSHRLKNNWLVGGASNAGGAVLTADYSLTEIEALTLAIKKSKYTLAPKEQAAYYPLTKPGERFPIADFNLQPTMPIKPTHPFDISVPSSAHQLYFLGLIHGLIRIELLAYEKLQSLGCKPLKQIYTVGGGVHNQLWMTLRSERIENSTLAYKMAIPVSLEAAFGVTRLIE